MKSYEAPTKEKRDINTHGDAKVKHSKLARWEELERQVEGEEDRETSGL